jgi:2-methylcitrate dehydratase PrpD
MNILDKITAYLVQTDYEALTPALAEFTKMQILDTIGVTIAGSSCSISGEMNGLAKMVKEWGGKKESTILGFGGRFPAANAAFVNGVSSTRLDFDDTIVTWINLHSSRAIVPAAVAMAERQGKIGGKRFITAVALGYDLACRIKQACGYNADMAIRFTSNFFGAAAAAGIISGLDEEKMKNALFLAFHQVSGAGSTGGGGIASGASLKGLSNGFAAKAGIISVLLAEQGFTSELDFLDAENKNNYYQMFCGGSYLPWILTSDLGKVFSGLNTSLKEYPCCHGQHAAIEAALGLMKEHDIRPEDVAEVTLRLSPVDYGSLASPLETKQNPKNIIDTQFSVCWGVASAIIYGEVGIKNFSEEALREKRVCEMARKVFGKIDASMSRESGFPAAGVDIRTVSGQVYSRQVDNAYGTVGNPMSMTDIISKFRYCCRYSVNPIPEVNQERAIEMVARLEKINDVSRIPRLLG